MYSTCSLLHGNQRLSLLFVHCTVQNFRMETNSLYKLNFFHSSQEKCALLTSELESLQESSAYSIGAPGESSLSFELSEADL